MENNRGRFTKDNVNSIMKGIWISFLGILVAVLPYLEKGLDGIQNNPDTPPVELGIAFLVSNLINILRVYLKA